MREIIRLFIREGANDPVSLCSNPISPVQEYTHCIPMCDMTSTVHLKACMNIKLKQNRSVRLLSSLA